MGAGKTTAISAISEAPPIQTDVVNTDATHTKTHTTVGLDFGQLQLDNGDRLRLFGTPGQARFEFLWDILAVNALGIIILTDNSQLNPLLDLEKYLIGFSKHLEKVPCVIGVGRLSTHPKPSLDDYSDFLFEKGYLVPTIEVDVRQRSDVLQLIDVLLTQVEAHSTAF